MIIVEGTDLTGKTTLCKEIAQKSGLQYHHLSRLDDDFHRYFGYLDMMRPSRIYDRFHLSELAYIYARQEELSEWPQNSPHWFVAVDRAAQSNGNVTVIVTADEELLKARHSAEIASGRDEMYSIAQILRANEAFLHMVQNNEWQGYPIVCDVHIHLNEEMPWVDAQGLDYILNVHNLFIARASYLRATMHLPVPIAMPAQGSQIMPASANSVSQLEQALRRNGKL